MEPGHKAPQHVVVFSILLFCPS